jgi:type II secretory pathway pseudopilin PulG
MMLMKKILSRKRREKGLTLIEASMVLALSAVVVAGVMLYYQSASDNNRLQNAEGELGSIQTAVQTIFAGQSDYTGLKTTVLLGSSSIPPNLQTSTGLLNPWTSAVFVDVGDGAKQDGSGTPTSNYTIEFDGLPQGACMSMASQQLGSSLVGVAFGTPGVASQKTPSPTAALAGCTADNVKVYWTFK